MTNLIKKIHALAGQAQMLIQAGDKHSLEQARVLLNQQAMCIRELADDQLKDPDMSVAEAAEVQLAILNASEKLLKQSQNKYLDR